MSFSLVNDIKTTLNIQTDIQLDIPISFHFENNKACIFFIKSFTLHKNHFIIEDFTGLNRCVVHHFYKNQSSIAYESEIIESNYDKQSIPS